MIPAGRMYFVPEGQHDRSQARSAWDSATPKEPSRRVRYDSCRCAHPSQTICNPAYKNGRSDDRQEFRRFSSPLNL
jgi:hypothetical protein